MSQLPSDCLNEIFEYLEGDKITLHSCLLVNHLWCEVSVRILWRSIRNYNILIACLPNDSKEILSKNGIFTLTSALRPPMFNYVSFCKVLSIHQVNSNIKQLLNQYISPQNLKNNLSKVIREIFKFLIAQTSLREVYLPFYSENNREFTSIPGVMGCLGNLSELSCGSDICSEFFYQLSQTCHNIQSLTICFKEDTSYGLADLISVQQNLKVLNLMRMYECEGLTVDIITSLTNLPDTLIKLDLYDGGRYSLLPLSFIAKLTNLQEIILSSDYDVVFEDFKELQYVTFSQLQILKFQYVCPRNELLIKFLESNGKNLKEFYADNNNNSLNLTIAKFCPNLRKLFTGFRNDEIEMLKMILNSCQYLESIQVWCCDDYLSEEELFEIFVKYSPKNFHELKLCYSFYFESGLLPEKLDTFFTSWTNRTPQKSLSLITICNVSNTLDKIDGNMEIIEKYIRLGIIKEFRTIENYWDDF